MKDKILQKIKETTETYSIETLKEALKVSTSDEIITYMKSVNSLIDDAVLIESNNHNLYLIEDTNYMKGRLDLKDKGFGFLIPDDPSEDDIFIPSTEINGAMNKDIVLVYITKFGYGARREGSIKRVITRKLSHIIGLVYKKQGKWMVDSDDKTIKSKIYIQKKDISKISIYDKVYTKIENYDDKGSIKVSISEVLGKKDDKGVDVLSKILKYSVDPIFNEDVLNYADTLSLPKEDELKGRKDLRKEKIITIDGNDAKDFDDAVIVKKLANGNYHLGVHIADVSHYVTEDSILDKEAYERGTSCYLPEKVIPMLPFQLSNELCSLKPGVDRLTISCDMEITPKGKVVKHDVYPSVIRSYERMTYENVNKIFMGDEELNNKYIELIEMFYDMRNLAKALNKERTKHGSINFETEESYIKLDENGTAVDIVPRERGVSETIIEEFMLKANQVVAEHVFWLDLPFIYRVHDKPKEEKLQRLIKMSNALGFPVKAHKEISHHELQKLHNAVKGTKAEKGISLLMLRSMQKAIYSNVDIGHYGLAFEHYTHFTSPIRRYPDLIVHRLLRKYFFEKNKTTKVIDHYEEVMPGIAKQASEKERNAMLLEREVVDMKKAEYITAFINQTFNGIISSVTSFGMYVTLPNTVEGLVHISALDDDYYHYDEDLMLLVGERKKKIYRVGDDVTVKVTGTNIPDGDVDFKIVKK
jgi:ribonuclease R